MLAMEGSSHRGRGKQECGMSNGTNSKTKTGEESEYYLLSGPVVPVDLAGFLPPASLCVPRPPCRVVLPTDGFVAGNR